MAHFAIETYGCQMNKSDSEIVAGLLEQAGYYPSEPAEADLILINTCSVRQHAEDRAMGRIASLKTWVFEHPARKLGILGCMAYQGEVLLKRFPYLSFVLGPNDYLRLPSLLSNGAHGPAVHNQVNNPEIYRGVHPVRRPGLSGWVTIMRGCSNYCAYCIVPYTRGPERSRPADEILEEIRYLTDQGFREITLLGQNVNSYRDGEMDFAALLRRAARIEGLFRVRFMTSHPKDLSAAVIQAIAEEKTLCRHIHLPVQSGSDRILGLMNRQYSRAHYMRLIQEARTRIPDIAFTTDVIVGFPGESENDFLKTVSLMKEIRFDDAFTYHYSPRPGTAAARMKDTVSRDVKLDRLDQIIRLQRRITLEKKMALVGLTLEVLPEQNSRRSDREWMGRTGTDHVVIFPKDSALPGTPVPVKIESCRGYTLRGKAVL
jgi:tRNA-2-methylthio-N6-dimethylallyladenosine synthase